jgi:histidyl-tRNA synthetase
VGPVWRNEKPGPGRYRQFTQFDADTVGTDNIAADAEMCMLAAATLEALGIARGDYVIKVSNRKILDQILDAIGLFGDAPRRLIVLRAIDKYDRLGEKGVRALLGKGRTDESGDRTAGAELDPDDIDLVFHTLFGSLTEGQWVPRSLIEAEGRDAFDMLSKPDDQTLVFDNLAFAKKLSASLGTDTVGQYGALEVMDIAKLAEAAGFGSKRIRIDPSVVRGLEYYTGPVFEAEITVPVTDEDGQTVRFGSVGGGGRYDDLVARFTGQRVPATGFSIGVSRLQAALAALNKVNTSAAIGPVVVLVMEKDRLADYQKMAQSLRAAGIRAEMYLGTSGMKAQMKYADKRGAPCVVIQGGDERAKGEVQIKDLVEGAKAAATIKDSKEWREGRPAQFSVPEVELVSAVRRVLDRHRT